MKRYFRWKHFGPFDYFTCKKEGKNFISAWWKGRENSSWGWEWGHDGVESTDQILIQVLGLKVLAFQKYREGFCLFIFGFWWIQ